MTGGDDVREALFIAVMGAAGALARWGLSGQAYRWFGTGFPYGTLLVNVLGSLLLGLLMHVGLATDLVPRALRTALAVGFLGAFTTYSTFAYETLRHIEDGAWGLAAANVAANLVLGLVGVAAGVGLGRLVVGGA